MSRSKESWECASWDTPRTLISESVKNSEVGWSMERLTPIEAKKTQANKFSYTGMTILYRNGKK